MTHCPPTKRKKGSGFNCKTCKVQKLRRCEEDREDFTIKDGTMWPMTVFTGGEMYGFCPGKATWSTEAKSVFEIAMISAETGQLFDDGGIRNQQQWFIDLLGWFLPKYDYLKFISKADMILGEDKNTPKKNTKR